MKKTNFILIICAIAITSTLMPMKRPASAIESSSNINNSPLKMLRTACQLEDNKENESLLYENTSHEDALASLSKAAATVLANPNKQITTETLAKSLTCETCNTLFSSKKSLATHNSKYHNTHQEKAFSCNICNKSFASIQALTKHKNTHPEQKPHKCRYCGESFSQPSGLVIHEHTHIQSQNQPQLDNQALSAIGSNRVTHRTVKKTSTQKDFPCSECTIRCPSKAGLIIHTEKVHNKVRPHICDIGDCTKAFQTNGDLKRHKETVHQGLRPYACDVCGKTFAEKATLKKHKNNKTPCTPMPTNNNVSPEKI